MIYEGQPVSCKELAKLLTLEGGKKYTHQYIGRVRKIVSPKNKGGEMGPEEVFNICEHLKHEMKVIESGQDEKVNVRVLKERCPNPRWLYAMDMERKIRCNVKVPPHMKRRLDNTGLVFKVERGCDNGKYFYEYCQ